MINILIDYNNYKENFSIVNEEVSYIDSKKETILILGITFKKNGCKRIFRITKNYPKEMENQLFYFINNIDLKDDKKIYKIIFTEKEIKLETKSN